MNVSRIAGRYEIDRLIGLGGMGSVYVGRDLHTGEVVAIKALNPEFASIDPMLVERFLREGEALRRLNHPNIVKVLAAIEDDNRHYIVMEYIPDGSLAEQLKEQPQMPVVRTIEIALDVADALTRAHRLHIIHRDIKPANVLLAKDGTARLTDFGVAHIGEHDAATARVTVPGSMIGTVAYLSPEACRGEALDARTDIWSLGVMLYEMLAGRLPFAANQTAPMLVEIMTKPVEELPRHRPDVPPTLATLIYRMLEKNRDARLSSMRLVGTALESILYELDSSVLSSGVRAPVEAADALRFAPITPPSSERVGPPHNLPEPPSPLVDREAELAEILSHLQKPMCRLLTLLGPGGIGKTRLALQAASEKIADFPDGVFYVPLAPVESVELVVPTIAENIKFRFHSDDLSAKNQLINFLREKRMLIVLDNFEHLVEGSGLLVDMLAHAPGVRLLVTSRERLHLREEWTIEIEGMPAPRKHKLDDLEQNPAVQLFLQSARRIQPGFEIPNEHRRHVARICELVEGIPLGIELAAAWVRMLTCEEIAQEIEISLDFLSSSFRDMPERHRSLRAAFEYSWRLLSDQERQILSRLSVFRGGFRRNAATAVAGASLMLLSALVDKSLLDRDLSGRYQVPGLLQQYAAEKLAESPSEAEAIREKHGTYYLGYVTARAPGLRDGRQKDCSREIEREIENIRAAWDWAVSHTRIDEIAQAMDGLYLFYDMNSRLQENEVTFRQVTEALDNGDPDPAARRLLARVLTKYGAIRQFQSRFEEARALLLRSVPMLEQAGVDADRAFALSQLGTIARKISDYSTCRDYYQRSVELSQAIDDRPLMGYTLNALAFFINSMGEYEEAKHLCERGLAIRRQINDLIGVSISLKTLGSICYNLGLYGEAQRALEEGVSLTREMGDRWGQAFALLELGDLYRSSGQYKCAQQIFEDALDIFKSLGDRMGVESVLVNLGRVARAMGKYQFAKSLCEQSIEICQEINLQWGIAFSLYHLGRAEYELHEYHAAGQHFHEAFEVAVAIEIAPLVVYVAVGSAMALVQANEHQRAAELLALILQHPAGNRETKDEALHLLAALGEDPEILTPSHTFDEVVAQLLYRD
jgi:serine/threonine protein kinase/tetratricopeptide (TPR) repeat protein